MNRRPSPGDTDEVLLALIARRDVAAMEALYDRQSRLVYSLALRIVHNVPDAEEIAQEVFMRVWDKADSFDSSKGSARTWLVTLTRRLAIDRTRSKLYRSRQREVAFENGKTGTHALDPLESTGEEIVAGAEAQEVMGAVRELDEPYREVIRLAYFEGLSHANIADRLKIPLGTIKSRLREAVLRLRKRLEVETSA